jgi:hypothetical protein
MLKSGPFQVFLSSFNQEPVYVHAQCFCVLNDQLERRSSLKLSAGNSIHHRRWNYVTDLNQSRNKLRSCSTCFYAVLREILAWRAGNNDIHNWRTCRCPDCSRGMFDVDDPLLAFCPNKDFQQRYTDTVVNGKISPCKISRDLLYKTFTFVHEQMVAGFMDERQGMIHLTTFCFSSSLAETIVNHVSHCHSFYIAEVQRHTEPQQYEVMCVERNRRPVDFQKATLPSAWSYNSDFSTFTDVPMHLLFLGITKSTIMMVQEWMKRSSIHSKFFQKVQLVNQSIQSLQLCWCKVRPFSDQNFGGWVSENYLDMARIIPWFYSVFYRMDMSVQYADTVTDSKTWSQQIYYNWLKARSLNVHGDKNMLRNRVLSFQRLPMNEIPPITCNPHSVDDIFQLLKALTFMLECLMSQDTVKCSSERLESYVRHFLSLFSNLDSFLDPDRKIPTWITKYNFLSLLNLPDQVKKFGSVRNIWEGGVQGEGFLRTVKGILKTGLTKQWEKWLLEKLLFGMAYKNISETATGVPPELVTSDAKVYPTQPDAFYAIKSFRPFAAIGLQPGSVFVVLYRKSREVFGLKFRTSSHYVTGKEGLPYYALEIVEEASVKFTDNGAYDFSSRFLSVSSDVD